MLILEAILLNNYYKRRMTIYKDNKQKTCLYDFAELKKSLTVVYDFEFFERVSTS